MSSVIVAGVLVVTAVGLWLGQRRVLSDSMNDSLRQRADEAEARYLDSGSTVSFRGLASSDDDRGVQLVSSRGEVLRASPNLADVSPLLIDLDPDEDERFSKLSELGADDDTYRVLTRTITGSDETVVLHVLQSTDDMEEAIAALAATLLVGVPAVVATLAALMWWLIGRTLRPVDLMRQQVEAITASDGTHRIELPPRHDEIGRLAGTMNTMLDRLAAATTAQRGFVADAAHELRTPLTRIRTAAEVGFGHDDDAEERERTRQSIVAESIELQRLIDDLLLLARADAGQLPMRSDPVDLDDIVLAECGQQRTTAPNVDIDTRAVSGAHLHGDAAQLTRMVRNLLTNATRHAGSRVEVALRQTGPTIEFSVSDDGPGVPAVDRERIFDRFARVDESRSRIMGGTGLGLAIARDIATRHGGSVVYDADGVPGARFVVRLPGRD
ncbi:MAG: HAMP domain-containing histidine kinase [Acidimicrobiia bacterium]|nr:HAMP domain-containing histidine kinase [Acidimicrobiia bacterium]